MHLTEDDIRESVKDYEKSLRQAAEALPDGAPSLKELENWMSKHGVEHPQLLRRMIGKFGTGVRGEKKMS